MSDQPIALTMRWWLVPSWTIPGVFTSLVGLGTIWSGPSPVIWALGTMLIGIGAAMTVRSARTSARVADGHLVLRNDLRSGTIPLSSIRAIGTKELYYPRLLRSYGRLVVTDGHGATWPVVASTGQDPGSIALLVRTIRDAAPDVLVDVDLTWFPHDRSPRRGTEHLASDPAT